MIGQMGEEKRSTLRDLAGEASAWIEQRTANVLCADSSKAFVASALLRSTFEHFNSICFLLDRGAQSSALALLRVEWQSLINGLWVYLLCPEKEVVYYWAGERDVPGLKASVRAVENAVIQRAIANRHEPPGFKPKSRVFTKLAASIGSTMHDYTHMGGPQIRALGEGRTARAVYSAEVLDAVLFHATTIAFFAVGGLAWVSDLPTLDDEAEAEFRRFNSRITHFGDVDVAERLRAQAMNQVGGGA